MPLATGDPKTDEKLERALGKGVGSFLRLASGPSSTSEAGVAFLCEPSATSWIEVQECALQLAVEASNAIYAVANINVGPVIEEESECRNAVSRVARGLYKRILKRRAVCFTRNGLLGGGELAERYDCMAPAVPDGENIGVPTTGLPSVDKGIRKALNNVRSKVNQACLDDLSGLNMPGPLLDPTGGVFGRQDLVQLIIEEMIVRSQPTLTGIYAEVDHCGDGVVQSELGEQCDDGDRDSCETDSVCDWNCTVQSCGNAVGCAGTGLSLDEECDDGNLVSGDGCTPACAREYCGDGVIQTVLGEQCDDANTDDLDGCSSNCQSGL